MYTYNLGAHAEHSDYGVKRDMELICNREDCENPHICDIEHEDETQTLALVTASHYTEKHNGEGNFTPTFS